MTQDEAFLDDVEANPGEPALRLIYADWLTEQGDPRGAYLRAEAELAALAADDARRPQAQTRLKEMRPGIDAEWLARIDRTPVENCEPAFAYKCPKRWENMGVTGDDKVRFCAECRKPVFYCDSVEQAQAHAWDGQCVAIDSVFLRRPGDLITTAEAVITAGLMLPPEDMPPQPPRAAVVIRTGALAGMEGEIERDSEGERVLVRVVLDARDVLLSLRRTAVEILP